MPERSIGDAAQIRLISEQIAEAMMVKFTSEHPQTVQKAEIPPPLKWAAGIMAVLFTGGVGAFLLWMVTTLNEMQITVARIDERQQSSSGDTTGRFQEIDRRISALEEFHRAGAGR